MKTTYQYDHYFLYQDIIDMCTSFVNNYPDLCSKETICITEKNREVIAMTLTNKNTGDPLDKPAFYMDANTHAGEITGNVVAMHMMDYLLTNYASNSTCKKILDEYTVYVIPRITMDGSEVYLTSAYGLRSADRDYNVQDSGIKQFDLDDDGVIRSMRIKNKHGAWKKDVLNENLMVEREPDDIDGEFYDVFVEGIMDNYNGVNLYQKKAEWGLDFNRNYPYGWYNEVRQSGAGYYPLSNPENKAVVDFVLKHPNIGAVLTMHTSGGVLLYPPGTKHEKDGDPTDMKIYKTIGKMATKELDYPCINIFDNFNKDQVFFPSGAFDDWCYQDQGIYAYTMELWDLNKHIGKPVDWFDKKEPTIEDMMDTYNKMIKFSEENDLDAFKPWTKIDHPQFGEVEVGGFNHKFLLQNCPCKFLKEEVEKATKFSLRYLLALPKLNIEDTIVTKLADNMYKVEAVIANDGYMPTYLSNEAKKLKKDESIKVTIENCKVLTKDKTIEIDSLGGYSLCDTSSSLYGNLQTTNRNDIACKVEWIIETGDDNITIMAYNNKCGKVSKTVSLA
ncbi:MAG: M14 family metallopeptidase [Erysipelotrichaceae bacterium]|nr:M14 family metallopeptidase [Erysipelotrichaceae bacterium]